MKRRFKYLGSPIVWFQQNNKSNGVVNGHWLELVSTECRHSNHVIIILKRFDFSTVLIIICRHLDM